MGEAAHTITGKQAGGGHGSEAATTWPWAPHPPHPSQGQLPMPLTTPSPPQQQQVGATVAEQASTQPHSPRLGAGAVARPCAPRRGCCRHAPPGAPADHRRPCARAFQLLSAPRARFPAVRESSARSGPCDCNAAPGGGMARHAYLPSAPAQQRSPPQPVAADGRAPCCAAGPYSAWQGPGSRSVVKACTGNCIAFSNGRQRAGAGRFKRSAGNTLARPACSCLCSASPSRP